MNRRSRRTLILWTTVALGAAGAAPVSPLMGVPLPGAAERLTHPDDLADVAPALNGLAARLEGACATSEYYLWDAPPDPDALQASFVAGLRSKGAAAGEVARSGDDDLALTLYRLSGPGWNGAALWGVGPDEALLAWCRFKPAVAAAAPRPAPPQTAPPQAAQARPAAPPADPPRPAATDARLPDGRYKCSTLVGSFPNAFLSVLGELRLRPDGSYQGVAHGGGGPTGRYTFAPATGEVAWERGLGAAFGTLIASTYHRPEGKRPFLEVRFRSRPNGPVERMTCSRDGA